MLVKVNLCDDSVFVEGVVKDPLFARFIALREQIAGKLGCIALGQCIILLQLRNTAY